MHRIVIESGRCRSESAPRSDLFDKISMACCVSQRRNAKPIHTDDHILAEQTRRHFKSDRSASRYDDKIQSSGRLVVHPLITEVGLPVKSATRYSPIFDK